MEKEILSYDLLNEFEGEREITIKQLAEENKCNEKDIKSCNKKTRIKTTNFKSKICWN